MLDQRGQAAIFVALMFNVLFVFFAMSINVALVVHDKINLQNSADMAAYYAATKQAELLNVIAHENYAIRQSWKLLSWRYRTLGTMGLYRAPSPPHPVWTGELTDTVYPPAVKPAVCVTYKPTWQEVPNDESLCNTENLRIPPLPQVQVIAGFLGINAGIAALSNQLRQQFDAQCERHGAYNWWFAASIMYAFRVDQHNRKEVIRALAQNMSNAGTTGDFVDLDGNSVLAGAKETFLKNLTFTNKQAFESGGNFQMLNSMAGVDSNQWLPVIGTDPTILYTDVDNSAGCNASVQDFVNLPQRPAADALLNSMPNASELEAWRVDKFSTTDDMSYSMGVEKNPWYMAYMGVQASTSPRNIFFPMGSGVPLTARAFAKPFGGRIGPWYQANWVAGDPNSSGTLVDPLLPPRMSAGGLMNNPQDPTRLPNYSRYPGDTLGMSSKLALNAIAGLATLGISFNYYNNVSDGYGQGGLNDPLAWDATGGGAPPVRNFEIAQIAPDLFDITYYSIEPNFSKNYYERLLANASALGIQTNTTPVLPDLGHSPLAQEFSVQDQMLLAQQQSLQRPEAFYFVRNKTHLLTAWLPGAGSFNYDVQSALTNFGHCTLPDDGLKFTNPGSCVAGGGRTGYSVKLISRDALLSSQHKIGGANSAPGAILNPPKGDGW